MPLGLFPLNAVLFPTAMLPLHIFEERYKQLINGCVADSTEFGVNLLDNTKVHEVGCSARVVDVVTRYGDGRLDIVVRGMRRYRMGELDTDSFPYAVSEVDWLLDDTEYETVLFERTAEMFNELISAVYGGAVKEISKEELAGSPSFVMAQKAGLDLSQRQQLLSLNHENARLAFLESYFLEVLPKVRESERIQGIVRNDGYL